MDEKYGQLIEPPPVKFAFGAPGWYVLGVLILVALLVIAWLCRRYYVRNLYRKRALQWLSAKGNQLLQQRDYSTIIYESNMLIKRVAMARYGRAQVAGIRGKDWITYMNAASKTTGFGVEEEQLINTGVYHPQSVTEEQASSFLAKTKHWISKHQRKPTFYRSKTI